MRLPYAAAVLVALMFAPNALAQSATGTWTGETSGAGGLARRSITLVLEGDGTGPMEVDAGVREILDLQVEGNRVSFGFRPLIAGAPAGFVFRYDGEFEGDTMTLYVSMEREGAEPTRGEDPIVLTRE